MPFDLQTLQAQSALPLRSVQHLPGLQPETIQIRGGPFDAVEEVLINGTPSPSIFLEDQETLLAQVPSGQEGAVYSVEVLSPYLPMSSRAIYRFRMGQQPRLLRGLPKLIQTYIRILLQTPGSSLLNPEIGGGLLSSLRTVMSGPEVKALISAAYLAVEKTTGDIVSLQARTPNLPREERLAFAELVGCGPYRDKLYMELKMGNQANEVLLASTQILPYASRMNILRGKYDNYEGPMFPGMARVQVSPTAEVLHKLVGVTTATEGGCYDSMNGYDRCVISLGAIQYCGAIGLIGPWFQEALNAVPKEKVSLLREWEKTYKVEVLPLLIKPVSALNLATQLYGCVGTTGSWTQASWERANRLFRALQPILADPTGQRIQLIHTANRILSFVMPETRKVLFQTLHPTGYLGALQAIVVSFSANLPAVADRHFLRFVSEEGPPVATKEYVSKALDALTFRPQIAIYPHRRLTILPELRRLYQVDLSDTPSPTITASVPRTLSTKEVQEILLRLGYDLGPKGADGVFGQKTRNAIASFQARNNLTADGIVGPRTTQALLSVK